MPDDLRGTSRPDASLDAVAMPTFIVTDTADEDVGELLVLHFGADKERRVARLRFDDNIRYIERTEVFRLAPSGIKGFGVGDAGRAKVPGESLQLDRFEFVCPVKGCPDSPVYVRHFNGVPACRIHGVPLVAVP